MTEPIQVVIDTNVLVTASRSTQGASFALLQRMLDKSFEMNVSSALLLEYEEKLKAEMANRSLRELWKVDRFLDFVMAVANPRIIYFSLNVDGVDQDDQFLVHLAIASRSPFIVTYNLRHFIGAGRYGIKAIRPGDLLRILARAE